MDNTRDTFNVLFPLFATTKSSKMASLKTIFKTLFESFSIKEEELHVLSKLDGSVNPVLKDVLALTHKLRGSQVNQHSNFYLLEDLIK